MSRKQKPSVGIRKPSMPDQSVAEAFVNGETPKGEGNVVSIDKKKPTKPSPKKQVRESSEVGVVETSTGKRRKMSIYFDDFDLANKLKVKAAVENREMSKIVEQAVREYLK